jgi:hypothetical protein
MGEGDDVWSPILRKKVRKPSAGEQRIEELRQAEMRGGMPAKVMSEGQTGLT